LDKVKNSEEGGNLLFKYLGVALFEFWDKTVCGFIDGVSQVVDIRPIELEETWTLLQHRLVDFSKDITDEPIEIYLTNSECYDFLNDKTLLNDPDKEALPKAVRLTLPSDKYELLCGLKRVYPNNRAGWSLALANIRVMGITRDMQPI